MKILRNDFYFGVFFIGFAICYSIGQPIDVMEYVGVFDVIERTPGLGIWLMISSVGMIYNLCMLFLHRNNKE